MYKPQTEPLATLGIPDPRINYPVLSFFRGIIQPYARAHKFREPVMLKAERMVDAYHDFRNGKTRLIVGFRHAYGDDPQLMAYVFHHVLPRSARRIKKPLGGITHAHFVYGAEVPLWSGSFVRWLLPNVGAVPIDHVHMDSEGMNRIRKIIADGSFPLALAPEGHVTYSSESIGELETGTARFGFWCCEDLVKAGRDERVVFLPVSFHYRYGKGAEKKLARMIERLESSCGIAHENVRKGAVGSERLAALRSRLGAVGLEILSTIDEYYSELNGAAIGASRDALIDAALSACERILSIPTGADVSGKGPFERLYRIRATGWDRIFRGDTESMKPLRRDLAGRETGEAWYAMRHMETAELLIYVNFGSIPEDADINRCFEIANNFYDMIERLRGGTLRNRANVMDKVAVIVPGEPIVISEYIQQYRADRKGALRAVTDRMRAEYEKCIEEYKNEYSKASDQDKGRFWNLRSRG